MIAIDMLDETKQKESYNQQENALYGRKVLN